MLSFDWSMASHPSVIFLNPFEYWRTLQLGLVPRNRSHEQLGEADAKVLQTWSALLSQERSRPSHKRGAHKADATKAGVVSVAIYGARIQRRRTSRHLSSIASYSDGLSGLASFIERPKS